MTYPTPKSGPAAGTHDVAPSLVVRAGRCRLDGAACDFGGGIAARPRRRRRVVGCLGGDGGDQRGGDAVGMVGGVDFRGCFEGGVGYCCGRGWICYFTVVSICVVFVVLKRAVIVVVGGRREREGG